MKTQFIINLHSGRNRRRKDLARELRDYAVRHHLDAVVTVTEGPRHATEIARRAVQAGCKTVVAVGGDGTMNEVGQALVGTPTVLALVPCGSGNGLARHLGVPRALPDALDLLRPGQGSPAAIDTGLINDRPFFNAAGFGFDAEVSRRFNGCLRRGLPAYVRAGYQTLRHRRPERCTVITDFRQEPMDVLLLAVTNSDEYGNRARIAPGALVDDGLLNLVAIRPVAAWRLAALLPRLFLGTIDQSPHVAHLRAPWFVIKRADSGIIHTDGEIHATTSTITVAVKPRSLRVLVPRHSRFAATPLEVSSPSFALQYP